MILDVSDGQNYGLKFTAGGLAGTLELALHNIYGFISPVPGHALLDIVNNNKPG